MAASNFCTILFRSIRSESKLILGLIKYEILLTWLLEFVIKSNEKIEINDCLILEKLIWMKTCLDFTNHGQTEYLVNKLSSLQQNAEFPNFQTNKIGFKYFVFDV